MKKIIARICFRIAVFFRQIGKQFSPLSAERQRIVDDWKNRDGERTLRYDYALNSESIIFDLGGFEGDWASEIFARSGGKVEIFEPYPPFAKAIEKRFENNPKIKVRIFGLDRKYDRKALAIDAESTSTFKTESSKNTVEIELKCAKDFLKENNYDRIDLIKINIEGGEYDLLDHLIEEGWIKKIGDLQIQFHHFVPNARARMEAIRKELEKTHELTWEFEFLWENWKRKK